MTGNKHNSKQIEEWAIIAVKDCLSMTDTLSQYIKENDKTPSWDGDVIIYKSNSTDKKDVIGKVTVQVKGEMADNINREECTFSVDMSDLNNYKNNGGTIYFVVLIDKNNPSKKRIFYNTLTPLKIGDYTQGHEHQNSKAIKFKKLSSNKYAIQTIFYNFYQDSKKQYSFSHIPPIRLNELSLRNDIVKITSTLSVFSSNEKLPSPAEAFLNNEVYWYAEIAGSRILHPIEWCPRMTIISKEDTPSISVNGERYDKYISIIQTKNNTTFQFGESTTLVFTEKSKGARITYQPSGSLMNRIKDLNFIISLVEGGEIDLGENRKIALGKMVADVPFDIVSAIKELESCKRIEQFWRSLHVVEDFDIGNIDSNSSLEELYLLMKSINGKRTIRANTEGEHTAYLLRKSISNFKILFFLDATNKEKSLYKIYNFFDHKGVITITREDETDHISSHYSVLSPDDYLELSNIDFSEILQSYKDLISLNHNIFESANFDLLNLLLAYDRKADRFDILNTAKEIARWLLNESGDVLPPEIKNINYLQVIKRERKLTPEENTVLYRIAESATSGLSYKLGANLLLENYNVAQIQYDQLCEQDKKAFRSFPIYTFWKYV